MTTQQTANRLVELCRKGDFETAQKELFDKEAVSIEPEASPGFDKVTKGLSAIVDKGHKFSKMIEKVHDIKASDPVIAKDAIAFALHIDATMQGKRNMMDEICVYKVKNGKIVTEEFFM